VRVSGKIFVNYRRDDAKAEAARLHDRLAQSFGAASVFMDVDNLLPGERFDLRLKEALAGTDVFLAVIGARWLDLLEARAQSGERDYVREEIAAALAAKLVVIPVLMDRAALPKAASLPEDIRELALYHKHDVVYESFGRDVQALIAAIETHRQALESQAAEAARLAREQQKVEIEATFRAGQKAKEEAEAQRRALEKERQAAEAARRAQEQAEIETARREQQKAKEETEAERRARAKERKADPAVFPWKPTAVVVAIAAVVILLIAERWSSSQRMELEETQEATVAQSRPLATFQTTATEGILIDAGTGAILFEKNADKLFAPASMSKIMTLEVLFKKLKAGEISLDTEFPVSLYAWKTGGAPSRTTSMFVPLNQTAKVGDLIQGIAVANANDGAIAVAEGLAGTDEAFGQMMTDEARALGLEKSTFGNSTGSPNPANLVTARELAKLSMYVIREYPEYYKYFAQMEFKYRTYDFKNLNPLLNASIPVDGLKFGFAENVGYGIAASAEKDGRRLVAVMNGFPSDKERREETLKLLSWGFVNFKSYKVFDKDEVVGAARVWGGEKWSVPVRTNWEVRILLPIAAKDLRINARIVYQGPLKPPVKEGDRVGEVRITSGSTGTSSSAPLYATASLESGGIVRKGIDSVLLGVNSLSPKR
jgi:D-alanyl-D-alanine carboxypeptidase (penicillin-binding protein 5/6)